MTEFEEVDRRTNFWSSAMALLIYAAVVVGINDGMVSLRLPTWIIAAMTVVVAVVIAGIMARLYGFDKETLMCNSIETPTNKELQGKKFEISGVDLYSGGASHIVFELTSSRLYGKVFKYSTSLWNLVQNFHWSDADTQSRENTMEFPTLVGGIVSPMESSDTPFARLSRIVCGMSRFQMDHYHWGRFPLIGIHTTSDKISALVQEGVDEETAGLCLIIAESRGDITGLIETRKAEDGSGRDVAFIPLPRMPIGLLRLALKSFLRDNPTAVIYVSDLPDEIMKGHVEETVWVPVDSLSGNKIYRIGMKQEYDKDTMTTDSPTEEVTYQVEDDVRMVEVVTAEAPGGFATSRTDTFDDQIP